MTCQFCLQGANEDSNLCVSNIIVYTILLGSYNCSMFSIHKNVMWTRVYLLPWFMYVLIKNLNVWYTFATEAMRWLLRFSIRVFRNRIWLRAKTWMVTLYTIIVQC